MKYLWDKFYNYSLTCRFNWPVFILTIVVIALTGCRQDVSSSGMTKEVGITAPVDHETARKLSYNRLLALCLEAGYTDVKIVIFELSAESKTKTITYVTSQGMCLKPKEDPCA